MEKTTDIVARILLAQIFLLAGISKITSSGYAGTQQYMEAFGIPGMLLPLVILLEIGGALALIIGFKTRWVAAALALFSVLAALIFHSNFGDQMQMILFMKNLAIAGGLVFIAGHGAGEFSLDHKFTRIHA